MSDVLIMMMEDGASSPDEISLVSAFLLEIIKQSPEKSDILWSGEPDPRGTSEIAASPPPPPSYTGSLEIRLPLPKLKPKTKLIEMM